ncbi:N-acyl-D-glucosamine 2-epimerase [Hymenobacter setariae]|uniref:Cellobiose 2-epimerase n=1 Tax=Hymenobacter setariae TaxID=2594794 RepID=A0A558BUL3_9BACT|nr:AGE family epimerase/isomerase [Hymenobacter setariae]TVT40179.1 N-acyl-D-glucosamine 2-epimerase [Hymenobacter setariae]
MSALALNQPTALGAPALLATYQAEMAAELTRITDFWLRHAVDEVHGGFIGQMDESGQVVANAAKGAILNARILWTFAAAYRYTQQPEHLAAATRAFDYFLSHFVDSEHGGVYWLLDAQGHVVNTRKQMYALAFAIYGLSEYHLATGDARALTAGQVLFEWIEARSYDPAHGGYLEAVGRTGEPLADPRLSEKDRPAPKTMNTHLHVLEAYANLYRCWPDARLAERLGGLLRTFLARIIDARTGHLQLFFDLEWQPVADLVSYGHDIETAWLLREAAEVLGDAALLTQVNAAAARLVQSTAAAQLPDGSLPHELDRATGHLDQHREWWVSAEAMVGFLDGYAQTHDEALLRRSYQAWQFAQRYLLDTDLGEWRWGVEADYQPMRGQDKIGFWKCPYHNARACLEVLHRCRALTRPA